MELPMLCDVWEPGDSWVGISNQARRKKLQNKLNQRAYRELPDSAIRTRLMLICDR